MTASPLGGVALFNDATTASPRVTVDKYGTYILTLTVSNGTKTATSSVSVTYEKVIEYTNALADNSVAMISSHFGIDNYSAFINNFYYDTSDYMTLEVAKVNSNGARVEKIRRVKYQGL